MTASSATETPFPITQRLREYTLIPMGRKSLRLRLECKKERRKVLRYTLGIKLEVSDPIPPPYRCDKDWDYANRDGKGDVNLQVWKLRSQGIDVHMEDCKGRTSGVTVGPVDNAAVEDAPAKDGTEKDGWVDVTDRHWYNS